MKLVGQVVPVWQPAFLTEIEQTGNMSAACRAAQVNLNSVMRARRRDPEFDARCAAALRTRKLTRDPNDHLVEVPGTSALWEEPWAEDENLTVEQAWLVVYAQTLNASEACRRVGVSYQAYARRKASDEGFARLVSLSAGRALDELEGSLYFRALAESDPAAIAILRAHRPAVYRQDAPKVQEGDGPTLEEAMKRGFQRRMEGTV